MKHKFVIGLLISSVILIVLMFAITGGITAQGSAPESGNAPQAPVGSAFTYQGQLKNGGNAVTGSCQMAFRLYDALVSGSLIGSPITTTVPVTNGLFTVGLNFGSNAFNGNGRWLDINVDCGSGFVPLTPRQAVTAAPYSLFAISTGALQSYPVTTTAPISGQVLKWSGSAWIPGVDAGGTAYSAGFGLTLIGNQFNVVTSTIQQRVSSSCPAGNAIRMVNTDGSVTCEPVSGNFWGLTGNSGTGGTGFVGTTDNTALTIGVNGTAALRIYPQSQSPNLAGGYSGNTISSTLYGQTIAGGGSSSSPNRASAIYATIGGGSNNLATMQYAFVGGGYSNTVATGADYGTIAGGRENRVSSFETTVGGGRGNTARGGNSTIGGGYANTASGSASFIGGGQANVVTPTAAYGALAGGLSNSVNAEGATIAGGKYNIAGGAGSTIGGGGWNGSGSSGNIAYGAASTIDGGYGNYISPDAGYGVIGGGQQNSITATPSSNLNIATIGGGYNNKITLGGATIGGGNSNTASNFDATVGGGNGNVASGSASFIGGGQSNIVTPTAAYGALAGGLSNSVNAEGATIAGGKYNIAAGDLSAIGGGGSNTANGSSSWIGGGANNLTSGYAATIGGGTFNTTGLYNYATVGGGTDITANGGTATVGGGSSNAANGDWSFVGGGLLNIANGVNASISGGNVNFASGDYTSIMGGSNNTASGYIATVAGGSSNVAQGTASFAAGTRAKALHTGTFVWGDSSPFNDVASTAANQFVARASGGVTFFTSYDLSTGVTAAPGGGSWSSASDRNIKANFSLVDSSDVLKRLAQIPISTWNYKAQDTAIRHIGPMAQDFAAAFGVGEDDTHISTIDAEGVSLAAIQGLYQMVQDKDRRIAQLETDVAQLKQGAAPAQPVNVSNVISLIALGGVVLIGLKQRQGQTRSYRTLSRP